MNIYRVDITNHCMKKITLFREKADAEKYLNKSIYKELNEAIHEHECDIIYDNFEKIEKYFDKTYEENLLVYVTIKKEYIDNLNVLEEIYDVLFGHIDDIFFYNIKEQEVR